MRAALLLGALLFLVSCGLVAAPEAPPVPTRVPAQIRPPLPAGVTAVEVTLYFPRYFEDTSFALRATTCSVGSDDLPLRTMEALIRGPDGPERADDLNYPLSPRTKLLSVREVGGVVNVDLGPEVAEVRGRPYSELAYWSIVYTLTDLPGIQGVTLLREGQPLREFGFPPVPISEAANRAQAPAWVTPR